MIKELEGKISRIPGVPTLVRKHHLQSFVDSPFTKDICLIDMPSRFTYRTMNLYSGNDDPDDHITQYKQRMHTTTVHQYQREACICKGFGSNLNGPALQGFVNLPNGSISLFAKLHDLFVEQFSSSTKIEK